MKEMGRVKVTKRILNGNKSLWGWYIMKIADEAVYAQCKEDVGGECRTVKFPSYQMSAPVLEGDFLEANAFQMRAGTRSFDYKVLIYITKPNSCSQLFMELNFTMVKLKEEDE